MKNSADEFMMLAQTDEQVRGSFSGLTDVAGVVQLASQYGYSLTEGDLRSTYRSMLMSRQSPSQLGSDDLELVAGSANFHLRCTTGSHQCSGNHCGGG